MVVADDALLPGVIANQQVGPIQPLLEAASRGEVFTTGSWYWRLSRALAQPGQGALSRALAALEDEERQRAYVALGQLPAEIGLLSLRRLVPVMAALGGQLNLLTAEAVAAAVVLEGEIVVTTDSALLDRIAGTAGVSVRVTPLHS